MGKRVMILAGGTGGHVYPALAVARELMDRGNDVVWVGTGESNMRNTVSIGTGIYKTTDGGDNWVFMGLPNSEHKEPIEREDIGILKQTVQSRLFFWKRKGLFVAQIGVGDS